ncbi:MAG TPA: hypothetical protein VIJ14_07845 [Rhabdochlamydiaceae bacterium]
MVNKISPLFITQNFRLPLIIPGLISLVALSALAALIHFLQKAPQMPAVTTDQRQPKIKTPVQQDLPQRTEELHYKNNVQIITDFTANASIKSIQGKLVIAESAHSNDNFAATIEAAFFKAFNDFETTKNSNDFSQLSDALTQEIRLLHGLARIQKAYHHRYKNKSYEDVVQQLDSLYASRKASIEAHYKQYQTLIETLPESLTSERRIPALIEQPPESPITSQTYYFQITSAPKPENELKKVRRLVKEIVRTVTLQHKTLSRTC